MGKDGLTHILEIKEMLGRFDERLKNIEKLAPAVADNSQEIDRIKTSVKAVKVFMGIVVAVFAFFGITLNLPSHPGVELRQ